MVLFIFFFVVVVAMKSIYSNIKRMWCTLFVCLFFFLPCKASYFVFKFNIS